jgi:hypothetical protein
MAMATLNVQDDDGTALIDRLSKLLDSICLALKGKPPIGVLPSWHDLPEIALAQRAALQNIMQILGPAVPLCQGCSAEIDMALAELKKVGIEYKRRKPSRP